MPYQKKVGESIDGLEFLLIIGIELILRWWLYFPELAISNVFKRRYSEIILRSSLKLVFLLLTHSFADFHLFAGDRNWVAWQFGLFISLSSKTENSLLINVMLHQIYLPILCVRKLVNFFIQRWEEQCHFDFMLFTIYDFPTFSQQIVFQTIAKNVLMLIATWLNLYL